MRSEKCIRCEKEPATRGYYCEGCNELAKMEDSCRDIAGILDASITKASGGRWGFTLMIFTMGEGGFLTYISNAKREDMILAIKEWLVKQGEQEM